MSEKNQVVTRIESEYALKIKELAKAYKLSTSALLRIILIAVTEDPDIIPIMMKKLSPEKKCRLKSSSTFI